MDKRSFLKNVGLMSLAMPLNFVHVYKPAPNVDHPKEVVDSEERRVQSSPCPHSIESVVKSRLG